MKIYFACSISGGRQDEDIYHKILQLLLSDGFDVPSAHIAMTGVEKIDGQEAPLDIYQRDVNWIEECDVLIAEVSTPSHGVGYEIGYALDKQKPVFCLHRQTAVVSKMITGNPHPLLKVSSYEDLTDLENKLRKYSAEIKTKGMT